MSVVHGRSAYSSGKCRCLFCTQAQRDYIAALQARLHAQGLPPDDPRHGTHNGYSNYGCRCGACSQVWSAYNRARRQAGS